MRNKSTGFTLIEVLLTLSLLGAFTLIAYRIIGVNFEFAAATRIANNESASLDQALQILKADVSHSSHISITSDLTMKITSDAKDSLITEWHAKEQTLYRSMGKDSRSWVVGHKASLQLEGPILLLTLDSSQPIAMASLNPPTTQAAP